MEVMSRQRGVSLISVPQPEDAGARSSGRGFDGAGASRHAQVARVPAMRSVRGFTLIELMVGILVAAVMLTIAVPSFHSLTLSNRLTTTANDIVGAINTARMEAIKLNAPTQLCSDSAAINNSASDALGTACGAQTGAVYALTSTGPIKISDATIGISPPLQLSGDLTALRFSTAGLGQAVGKTSPYSSSVAPNGPLVDICTSAMSSNNHRVIDITTGSIITTKTTSGACP
jgi:type IV fimbrial biogenesis protein FimT